MTCNIERETMTAAAKKITPYRAPAMKLSIQTEAHDNGPTIPLRVQILRTGEFNDPRYGTFEITGKHLSQMKANFDNKVRGVDIAIDYAHKSDEVAAGWIQGLELGYEPEDKEKKFPTSLWANPVKWTTGATTCLADGQYRYLSADFTFEYQDNETGEKYGPVLLGAGLTNRPVIKDMNPVIELQEGKGNEMAFDAEKKCKELEEKLAEMGAAMDKLKPPKDKSDQEDDSDEEDGTDADGDEDDDIPPAAKKKLAAMKAKLASYQEAEADSKNKAQLAEKKSSFDKKLAEGSVVEAQREPYVKGDMEAFLKLAQPVKLRSAGHGGEGGESGKGSAQEEVLNLAEKMASEKKIEMSEAISNVLRTNKDLRSRYEAETKI